MDSIIIVLLLILMMCTLRARLLECSKIPIVIEESFEDVPFSNDVKIKGAGLTPATTPARRPCAQLMVSNSQETSLLRPGDI